jgi:hypothetical protein
MVSAGKGRLTHLMDSFQAKAVACLQDVQVAINLGVSWVVIKTRISGVCVTIRQADQGCGASLGLVCFFRNETAAGIVLEGK